MARPKRKQGFRRIVVSDRTYRWRAGGPHLTADLEVVLEGESSERGSRLYANLVSYGTFNDAPIVREVNIRPALVERIINRAIADGWQPGNLDQPGMSLKLVIENGAIADVPFHY